MRFQFGAGQLFGNPTGASGGATTPLTVVKFGTLQDVNIEFTGTIKDLRGQLQFPDDTAISDKKLTWKSGSGRLDIDVYNSLFFAETISTGGKLMNVDESHVIPGTPFTITVTNSGTFVTDLGVFYQATGQRLQKVASGPVSGQYSVNTGTGVYTFAAADTGLTVLISYTSTIATGRILTVNSRVQGWGPTFEIFLSLPYQELTASTPNYVHLYACKCSKLGMPLKRVDYLISDLEGEGYANAAGQVLDIYED